MDKLAHIAGVCYRSFKHARKQRTFQEVHTVTMTTRKRRAFVAASGNGTINSQELQRESVFCSYSSYSMQKKGSVGSDEDYTHGAMARRTRMRGYVG